MLVNEIKDVVEAALKERAKLEQKANAVANYNYLDEVQKVIEELPAKIGKAVAAYEANVEIWRANISELFPQIPYHYSSSVYYWSEFGSRKAKPGTGLKVLLDQLQEHGIRFNLNPSENEEEVVVSVNWEIDRFFEIGWDDAENLFYYVPAEVTKSQVIANIERVVDGKRAKRYRS